LRHTPLPFPFRFDVALVRLLDLEEAVVIEHRIEEIA